MDVDWKECRKGYGLNISRISAEKVEGGKGQEKGGCGGRKERRTDGKTDRRTNRQTSAPTFAVVVLQNRRVVRGLGKIK